MGGGFFRRQDRQLKEEMTDEQVRRVIRNHHEQMRCFDYIPEEYKDFGDQLATAKQFAVGGITGVGRKLTHADKPHREPQVPSSRG